MAKKATEVTTELDYSNMNLYQKLSEVRYEFLQEATTKSGVNLHAEFQYFELVDIVPRAEMLFHKYGLFMRQHFTESEAIAEVIDVSGSDSIEFRIPLRFISEPAKFRMNEVQGVGAVVTYYRRYLYMLVLDLVESDGIDNQKPKTEDTPTPAPKKAPATPAQREEIKAEVTDTDGPADELQVQALKKALNALLDKDADQEEWVQSVALETEAFTKITKVQCEQLIEGVKEMIAAYGE